ncbi:hypothetical protein ABPG72_011545 [Tetrahymena utriculariae]
MGNSNTQGTTQSENDQNQPTQGINRIEKTIINSFTDYQELLEQKDVHNQVTNLDLFLSASAIGDDQAQVLVDGFKLFPQLNKLRLAICNHKLTENGIKTIFDSVKTLSKLSEFALEIEQFLEELQIGENGAMHISEALKCLSPSLNNLKLWIGSNKITGNGAKHIFESIKSLSQLQILELNLTGNQIGNDEGKSLVEIIESLSQLKKFNLWIKYNEIERETRQWMKESLEKLQTKGIDMNVLQI